jgi:hypothetical protein
LELPEHILALPLITPGTAGGVFTVINSVFGNDDPQTLFAVTEIFPFVVSAVVLIVFVVEVPVQPLGNVQVYEVAPFITAILYVFELPEQIVAFPLIVAGLAGAELTVTVNDLGDDEPQELLAITVILPPAEPDVAKMESFIDVPVQPLGRVQI